MKRILIIFFQIIVIIIGFGAIAFLLWEPQVEGVNANATNFEIYFKDPFLTFVYIGSAPLFVALYQAFKVLGCMKQNEMLSKTNIKSLQLIKYCAQAVVGFAIVGEIFIKLNDSDDRAGGVFMGVLIIFISMLAIALIKRLENRNVNDC